MRTKEEIIEELKKLQNDDYDIECNHIDADNLLCELLTNLGHQDVVDEFEKINKWYA